MVRRTERAYDRELRDVRERLLLMAGRVELMIADAVRALIDRDPDLAQRTIQVDRMVNRAELEIDELCMLILVRRQPMARDMRFVAVSLKMVTDLERIGDLAVNMAERAVDLSAVPYSRHYEEIARIAAIAQGMVRDVMDAFVHWDVARAEKVMLSDDEVDEAYHVLFRSLLETMIRDPSTIEACAHMQSLAKYLERIGDHATNLAEHVVFMVDAKDVRHHGKLGARSD